MTGPATTRSTTLPSGTTEAHQLLNIPTGASMSFTRGNVTIRLLRALAPAAINDIQARARAMLTAAGLSSGEWNCLDELWNRESRWNPTATNTSSGAYGIPQALPGSKMSSVASDWATNATTQITWGLSYITSRYGTPCHAWAHSNALGWY